ncbi:hypothetical protein TSYNTROOL_13360 [Tepidanaerobacter syntrophicus]|uniref:hypothetical protein n=1 Tax=Tepidanaerobacter syntrophicus TaxID=224999 RepID=UPI001BD3129E|nr:hypothetical protein [Tepidanaerobacter syntrophicus]GLI51250.1 hypothetical protein TSYNTROOL_13360 [Tepidanaerobacter syntrophicus]
MLDSIIKYYLITKVLKAPNGAEERCGTKIQAFDQEIKTASNDLSSSHGGRFFILDNVLCQDIFIENQKSAQAMGGK